MKTRKLYLKPDEFFNETTKSLKDGQMSEELGLMFTKLAEKYTNSHMFSRYGHIRDDLIATGILACVKGFDKFEPYSKLGLALKNDLLRQDVDDPSVFSYHHNGREVKFHYQDIKQHKQQILDDLKALEKEQDLNPWEGEDLTYDHKLMNNPFAFFTTCIHNSLLLFLKKEYAERNIFNKIKLMEGMDADFGYLDMVEKKEAEKKLAEENQIDDDDYVNPIVWNDED
jgi:hypothetical protein